MYDWVPDSYNLVVNRVVNDYWDVQPSLLAQLSEVTPLGELKSEYENTCDGDAANFNQISHECKIDTEDSDHRVLSFMYARAHAATVGQ